MWPGLQFNHVVCHNINSGIKTENDHNFLVLSVPHLNRNSTKARSTRNREMMLVVSGELRRGVEGAQRACVRACDGGGAVPKSSGNPTRKVSVLPGVYKSLTRYMPPAQRSRSETTLRQAS